MLKFNPTTGQLDLVGGSGSSAIPELYSDPSSPASQSSWVLATDSPTSVGGGNLKAFSGLGFPIIQPAGIIHNYSYQLSYKTKEGAIKRVSLT